MLISDSLIIKFKYNKNHYKFIHFIFYNNLKLVAERKPRARLRKPVIRIESFTGPKNTPYFRVTNSSSHILPFPFSPIISEGNLMQLWEEHTNSKNYYIQH